MNDETLLRTVQNGLMIAGHEMGPVGDHWPAINAIREGVARDLHEIQCDAAVTGELEFHIAETLRIMEESIDKCAPEHRQRAAELVKQYWEEYYAILEPMDAKHKPNYEEILEDNEKSFKSLRAAAHILKLMGGKI